MRLTGIGTGPCGAARSGSLRSARSALVLALTTVLLVVLPGAPASGASYVGLGDSAASGPVIPNQIAAPLGCWRSDRNFAHLMAQSLGISLTDVSCSGARTDHMWAPQNVFLGPNPAQFDALTGGESLVTLQIGGNDIGFGEIVDACTTASPFGHPCRDRYAPNWPSGPDELAKRIADAAPKVSAVLQEIRRRSPGARVRVVGYAAIVPHSGYGCWPKVALAWRDVPYLRATHVALNAMLRAQADANGVTYVDSYTASVGRDACQPVDVRWVEPTIPVNPAAPLHPNARGMRGVATTVLGISSGHPRRSDRRALQGAPRPREDVLGAIARLPGRRHDLDRGAADELAADVREHVAEVVTLVQRDLDRNAAATRPERRRAEPRRCRGGAAGRDLDQPVPGEVAELVVDARELLELQEHDREAPFGGRLARRLTGGALESTMVAEECEAVDRRGTEPAQGAIVGLAALERQALQEHVEQLVAGLGRRLPHALDDESDDLGIELRAGVFDELLAGLLVTARGTVGALVRHRAVGLEDA